ncbi:DUF4332 domain-containing protein [Myxacorys almedinensis A]|uniref:DUF4332 domain-containing protein n=2 Tax=Myxacorys TaxID=2056239 RepID=A0A8J7YZX5_9CYAN|nr:DUF4332 domain-containing protein [Myxacorys almedinensis]NDJ17154.1 DUF4332 domain-containing protein [Myxacorys almedinensis A]
MHPPGNSVPSANWSIDQLPGLSSTDLKRLHAHGIRTTFNLLSLGHTPEKRRILASTLETHIQHINKWIALADLARIPSVGCQHCGLLLHAGVVSPTQLVQTPIARLHRQMLKLQVAMMQRRDLCPTIDQINRWVGQARRLR